MTELIRNQVTMTERLCVECQKPLPEIAHMGRMLHEECAKKRQNEKKKKWREEHPELQKDYVKKYQQANPEVLAANTKRYRQEHPEKVKKADRLKSARRRKEYPDEGIQYTQSWQNKHREWSRKYQRVYLQRKKGSILCFWCEQLIPEEKLQKSGRKHPPKFCSQRCANEKKKMLGFYQKMSRAGINRQMEIKKQTGKRPGYEGRAAYMRQLNERRKRERGGSL